MLLEINRKEFVSIATVVQYLDRFILLIIKTCFPFMINFSASGAKCVGVLVRLLTPQHEELAGLLPLKAWQSDHHRWLSSGKSIEVYRKLGTWISIRYNYIAYTVYCIIWHREHSHYITLMARNDTPLLHHISHNHTFGSFWTAHNEDITSQNEVDDPHYNPWGLSGSAE